jgi:hypothetical protein
VDRVALAIVFEHAEDFALGYLGQAQEVLAVAQQQLPLLPGVQRLGAGVLAGRLEVGSGPLEGLALGLFGLYLGLQSLDVALGDLLCRRGGAQLLLYFLDPLSLADLHFMQLPDLLLKLINGLLDLLVFLDSLSDLALDPALHVFEVLLVYLYDLFLLSLYFLEHALLLEVGFELVFD